MWVMADRAKAVEGEGVYINVKCFEAYVSF